MNAHTPEGWTGAPISDLCDVIKRKGQQGLRPYLEIGDVILTDKAYVLKDKPSVKGCKVARRDDVLVSKVRPGRGAITWIREEDLQVSSAFTILRSRGALVEKYLWLFLAWNAAYLDHLRTHCTGTMYPTTSDEEVVNFVVPLAPQREQRRIVVRVEEVLAKVSASSERIKSATLRVNQLRRTVLASAFTGRLTERWRAAHPDIESASEVRARIRIVRLESAKTNKERSRVKEWCDRLPPEEGPEVPDTWCSSYVGTIGSVCNGSTPSRGEPAFWGGDIPWVSSGEVRNNIIRSTRERITNAGYENSSVRLLPIGTVLLAMIGEGKTRGQSAILSIEATINQNIAAIVIDHGLVRPEFLWRWFQVRYEATRERGSGSGPQALNCERVRELPFVLPPLEEQDEIIRCMNRRFAWLDKLEARLQVAAADVESLSAALLAKAFRGELVPSEAELSRREGREYESAATLLERLKSETKRDASLIPRRGRDFPRRVRKATA